VPVDSPASRVERVLIGLAVPLYLLTALAIADGRIVILSETDVNEDPMAYVFPALALLATLLYAYIQRTRDWPHGDSPLDRWFSRESEDEMRERLRQEQTDADVSSMGSAWAVREKEHLERTLGEEE
jgi:hypothetical protein